MEQGNAGNLKESMTMMCIMIWATQMLVILVLSLVALATIHTLAGLELVETEPRKVRLFF